jgi:predicted AAA+ superfamily ATPase
MFKRLISLDKSINESFFLWGPRQSGKSTLLHQIFADSVWIDLLKSEEFIKYKTHPERLREELIGESTAKIVVIDEIQKVPALLDEVHWLIENKKLTFALCGSSARKLKRGHANLLGGRAVRFELFGLCSKELGQKFDLNHMLNFGYIPSHYLSVDPRRRIRSYISDYLKEEIAEEAVTRNIPAFSDFLRAAALGDTEQVSYSTIGRDCGVNSDTVKNYYQILTDTMLGSMLPSYTRREKRRISKAPKHYFFDVGIVNALAKRGKITFGNELFGKAFENWIYHELNCHRNYSELFYDLSFWKLTTQIEVDFILGDMEVAIEVKGTDRVRKDHLEGLRAITQDHPNIKSRYLICCEAKKRVTEDGIIIINALEFLDLLWSGEIIS